MEKIKYSHDNCDVDITKYDKHIVIKMCVNNINCYVSQIPILMLPLYTKDLKLLFEILFNLNDKARGIMYAQQILLASRSQLEMNKYRTIETV
jgi:hypothetical protein